MTKQYTIPIEGIPDGWEATKVTINNREICGTYFAVVAAIVEIRKTKPREITLVETDEAARKVLKQEFYFDHDYNKLRQWTKDEPTYSCYKIWRIKDEQ